MPEFGCTGFDGILELQRLDINIGELDVIIGEFDATIGMLACYLDDVSVLGSGVSSWSLQWGLQLILQVYLAD